MPVEKSQIFHTERYVEIQQRIRDHLNAQGEFLSARTAKSPRAVGDAMQDLLSEGFPAILGDDVLANYSSDFARRAMADLAFEDHAGFYYRVDVKTHRLSTKFNMPNLTSVERLARFYEDDRNYFVVLLIAYDVAGLKPAVRDVKFLPIEFLAWDCLTIGALGWGQIQIANSNQITVHPGYSRKSWMLEMCDNLAEFYPKELGKISERIEHFKRIRRQWEVRSE